MAKDQVINIRVSAELHEKILDDAVKQKLTVSETVRTVLRRFYEKAAKKD